MASSYGAPSGNATGYSPTKTASAAPGTAPAETSSAAADPLAPSATATTTEPTSTPAAATTSTPTATTSIPAATASTPSETTSTPTTTSTAAAADTAASDAAPPALNPTDMDSEAGLAARMQADAQGKAYRMEEHRILQEEHPHFSMMADYLKNFATNINPKANTAAVPSYAGGPTPAATATGTAPAAAPGQAASSAPVFDAALLPATAGFAAKPKPKPVSSQAPPLHTGSRPDAPQRQGSAATAAAIEELQSGIEALVSAHINASRHVAGLTLVPVLINGPADNLPPITHAAALADMDDQSLASWAAYYLGDGDGVSLDRATMIKAIKAGVGIPIE